jgi:hypothetical protein
MSVVLILIIGIGFATILSHPIPGALRSRVRSRRMARSLATAVRRTNVERTYAALRGKAAPDADAPEERIAIRADLLRRAQDLRSWALAGCGSVMANTAQRRIA